MTHNTSGFPVAAHIFIEDALETYTPLVLSALYGFLYKRPSFAP